MRGVCRNLPCLVCFRDNVWNSSFALSFETIFKNVVCGYFQTDAGKSYTFLCFFLVGLIVFVFLF